MEKTLALVKPDAIARGLVGAIVSRIEECHFDILDIRMLRMSPELTREFYKEHAGFDYYAELCEFMGSAPVIAVVLGCADAVAKWRRVMGSADPSKREDWQLRAVYYRREDRLMENLVHGSDSPEAFLREADLLKCAYW